MTTKYTPGPWFVAEGGVCTRAAIEGNVICLEPEMPMRASLENWPANARLIAALPELVEALRNLCDGVANGSVGTEFLTARALLAKIDGEQP